MNLAWWENMVYGILLVVDGLGRFLSIGLRRPCFSTRYSLHRLHAQCLRWEQEEDHA